MKGLFQKMNRVIAMVVSVMMVLTAIPQFAYAVLGEELKPLITFDANGGVFPKVSEKASEYVNDGVNTTSQSFLYFKKDNGRYGADVGYFNTIEPTCEGYKFNGWVNQEDNTRYDYGDFADEINRTFMAKWIKVFDKMPTIDTSYGINGLQLTETSEGIVISARVKKEDFADIEVAENEVLKLYFEFGSTVPIVRNDDVKSDSGYYIVWNGKTLNKNEDAVVTETIFKEMPEGNPGIHVGLRYIIVEKDLTNNPESYIYSDWSNVNSQGVGYGNQHSLSDVYIKAPTKDITYGENGFKFDVEGSKVTLSAKVNKEDYADIKVADDEVLKIWFSAGSTDPIVRNDECGTDGYYSVWNGTTVDKSKDTIISEELFNTIPANEVGVRLALQYVIIKKDPKNPNNWIENDWSNVVRHGERVEDKTTKSFTQSVAGDIVGEDKSYDGVAGFERTEFTKDNVDISDVKPLTYTGDYIRPSVSVKIKKNEKWTTLVEGTDYIKTYTDNLNAGTATITVTGSGLYKGTYSETFTIAPKSAKKLKGTSATVMVGDAKNVIEESINIYDGLKVLEKGKDYQLLLDETNTANKGKTYVVVKGIAGSNYSTEELKVPVTVISAVENADECMIRSVELAPGVADKLIYKKTAYKASDIELVVRTRKGDVPNTDYSVSVKNTKDVGVGYVTVKAKGKTYKGSVTIPVEIKAPATDKIELSFATSTIGAVNFSGKLQRPKVTVKAKLNGGTPVTLKLNRDYKLIYENNLNATSENSKARVRVVGIGNYVNATEISNTFEIKPISISKVKGVGTKEKGLTLTFNKHQLVEGVDYKLEWKTDLATATKIPVVVTGLRNYSSGNPITKAVKIK